jgi:hypothetical protein
MKRKSKAFTKVGLSILLAFILSLLTYTSWVLPRNLLSSKEHENQPCDNRRVSSIHPQSSFYISKEYEKKKDELQNTSIHVEHKSQAKDYRIMELQYELVQVRNELSEVKSQHKSVIIDRADDGIRPLRVIVAHHPRSDMLGSFVFPSILLLAITYKYGWEMEILPYNESIDQQWLKMAFARASSLKNKGYGTSLQDASYREDYNPTDLNAQAYATLGFFPKQCSAADFNIHEWTQVKPLPAPGTEALHTACRKRAIQDSNSSHVECRLIVPRNEDTGMLLKHILAHGTLEDYINPTLIKIMQKGFLKANSHRIQYFNSSEYNVAIHVRRGDVNKDDFPDRWTEQSIYASIARHICTHHHKASIHVFSSGKNSEGWSTLQSVNDTCGSVSFHLDKYEFDAWAHFVAADALVTSRSTFSYVPALFAKGKVYAPQWGHAPLSHWYSFRNEDGKIEEPSDTILL